LDPLRKKTVHLGDRVRRSAVVLDAIHDIDQDGVRELERIFGVLGQRFREIGHLGLDPRKLPLALAPVAPSFEGHDGQAHRDHESLEPGG
jgi:hypothetical protein